MPGGPVCARSCREQLQQFGPRDGAVEFREEGCRRHPGAQHSHLKSHSSSRKHLHEARVSAPLAYIAFGEEP
jgi:hypothetical protein